MLRDRPNTQFWNAVQSHCGKAYEGVLELPEEDEGFGGKRLVMHVRSCGACLLYTLTLPTNREV